MGKAELLVHAGRVVESWRGRAIVELDGVPPAAGTAGDGCARCGLCRPAGDGRSELYASVAPGLVVMPGDRVEVAVRAVGAGRAALCLYGMPLAAFLTASIGVAYLTRSEAASALSGFAALGAAFLALLLIERRGGSRSVVTRKL